MGAIEQSGPIVGFHPAVFTVNGVVADGGSPDQPGVGALGIFNGPSTPFAVNSQTTPGLSTAPGAQFAVEVTETQATLIFTGVNGAANPAVFVDIDGVTYPFPAPPLGVGSMQYLPAVVGYGTPLNINLLGGRGVRFYLNAGDSISYTVAESQPETTPPAWTITGVRASNKDEPVSGVDVFITAWSGTPLYRIF
jgi:hypothetical protein